MNITDYIVESLKKGKTVEIAGIGQWTTREEAAHHDPQSHTFYPRRKVVEFTPQCKGDKSFVEYIASQECVGTNVADQMVKNYADTLTERMKAQGKVEINGLGTLGFGSFTVADSLNLGTDDAMAPIDGIKTYQAAADDDPLAAFEQPLRPIGEPEPEPVEAEPEEGTEPEPEPVEEQPVVEEPVAAEPEPAVAAAAVAGAVAASSLPSPDETVQMTKKEAKAAEKKLKEEQKRQKAEEKAKEKKEREESIRKQEELKSKEKAAKKEAEEAKKRAKKEEEEAKKKAKAEAKAEAKAAKKAKKEDAKPMPVAEVTDSHQEVNNG